LNGQIAVVVCDAVCLYLTAGIWKLTKLVLWFNIFQTVHLRIIMVDNQLDAQIFYNTFIYLNPLHVLSTSVLILWRTIVLTHNSGRVTQICVFNTVKLGTSASSP